MRAEIVIRVQQHQVIAAQIAASSSVLLVGVMRVRNRSVASEWCCCSFVDLTHNFRVGVGYGDEASKNRLQIVDDRFAVSMKYNLWIQSNCLYDSLPFFSTILFRCHGQRRWTSHPMIITFWQNGFQDGCIQFALISLEVEVQQRNVRREEVYLQNVAAALSSA